MTTMLNRTPLTIHHRAKGLRPFSQREVRVHARARLDKRVTRFFQADFRAPGLMVRGFFVEL